MKSGFIKKIPCLSKTQHSWRYNTEERLATYCDTAKVDQFDGADYANVDTLFSLGETYLFCQLVELKEKAVTGGVEEEDDGGGGGGGGGFLARKSFYDMYNEIRASVDLCHRDGTLKQSVADDPAGARGGPRRMTQPVTQRSTHESGLKGDSTGFNESHQLIEECFQLWLSHKVNKVNNARRSLATTRASTSTGTTRWCPC